MSRRLAIGLCVACCALPTGVSGDDHVRVLAASCAACHGTAGNSVGGTPKLAGLDRSHFILQMQSFRDGSRPSSVMHHHAKGLTLQEIEQLADHFATQPRLAGQAPRPLGGM
ncbi:MAG: c-type cytochrome [Methylophilaceae bacterium]|nr:c-type cytochrome [Methylophilaceae bacterium]